MASVAGLIGALNNLPRTVRHRGFRGGSLQWAGLTYLRATRDIEGKSIFSRDWDVLVILDACRADLLSQVAPEYGFLESLGTFPSLGSCTPGWMERNFGDESDEYDEHRSRTAYVAGNPFSRLKLDDSEFHSVDHVWEYAWDEDFGGVKPRPVTDRAIRAGRTSDADRLIVHYLQPHLPFLSNDSEGLQIENFSGDHRQATPGDWVLIQRGERDPDTVWDEYRDTLRWVLDDVELLIRNLDADSFVISADHGNAFGEFGVYGHPCRTALPCLTEVPWVETSAVDEETHEPAEYDTTAQNFELENRLEALGYR